MMPAAGRIVIFVKNVWLQISKLFRLVQYYKTLYGRNFCRNVIS
jgi:hypothetical protein